MRVSCVCVCVCVCVCACVRTHMQVESRGTVCSPNTNLWAMGSSACACVRTHMQVESRGTVDGKDLTSHHNKVILYYCLAM